MQTLLANCNVIDVAEGQAEPRSILTQGARIADLGPPVADAPNSDVKVFDMSGTYAIPGLVDLHQHVCGDANPLSDSFLGLGDDNDVWELVTESNLGESLSAGVTTVRDVGSYRARALGVRRAIDAGRRVGPNMAACGHLITYPSGHGAGLGIQVCDKAEAQRAVHRNVAEGADFIKIASDPEDVEAQGRSPNPAFSTDLLTAITETAHAAGLKVACHTYPSAEGVKRALTAGVDTLEHAVPFDVESLEMLLVGGAFIVPTVVAAADDLLPNEVEALLGVDARAWRDLSSYNFPPERLRASGSRASPSIVTWAQRLARHLPEAISAGAKIGIGTDAGCRGTNFRSAVREMHILVSLGATRRQVLEYATLTGAAALGRNDIGRLAANYIADIVFLDANPLEQLATLLRPRAVMAKGLWVS